MDDLKILLQAVIDQSSLSNVQKDLLKKQYKIGVDIDSSGVNKFATDLQRITKSNSMQTWIQNNSKATKTFGADINNLITKLRSVDDMTIPELKKIELEFKKIQSSARAMNLTGFTFTDSIKKGIGSFTTWLPATSVVMGGVNAFRDMYKEVVELNKVQVELAKVSDLSVNGLVNVTKEAYELGNTVAKTGTQVLDAVTEFKRAGYELNSSMDMAKSALVMTNVAEGITKTSEAAGTLISVLKGFKMSDSDIMSIVDKMNSVSNQSPIGFDELADGLERVSGTMNQAGNTIDQTLGLLTGGYAQLRNIEKVSSGMIFIQQRLRGIDEDGNAIEGLSAKLKDSFDEIGVSVENTDGSLRSMYDIATDYAKVLPSLTSKQKQYYGELAAGKRQITVWNAITEQISDVEKATSQSIDSIGSAAEENETYLDSIAGKIANFVSAFQQLSQTVIDSNLVKFFVDLGTNGVKALDGLINAITPLGTVGVGVGFFSLIKGIQNLDCQKVLKIA